MDDMWKYPRLHTEPHLYSSIFRKTALALRTKEWHLSIYLTWEGRKAVPLTIGTERLLTF